jgi:hypothetical protein
VRLFGFHERWMQGDLDGAWAELSRFRESATEDDAWRVRDAATTLGRLDVAPEAFDNSPIFRLRIAFLLEDRETVAEFRQVPFTDQPVSGWELGRILILVRSGFGDDARAALAELEELVSQGRFFGPINSSHLKIVRGALALDEGRFEDAIEHLRSALWRGSTSGHVHYFVGSMTLAQAFERQGDLNAAVKVLELARHEKVRVYGSFGAGASWLRVVSRLVDLYRAMGNEAAAAEREAELRALLRLADADHPLLVRLTASGSS